MVVVDDKGPSVAISAAMRGGQSGCVGRTEPGLDEGVDDRGAQLQVVDDGLAAVRVDFCLVGVGTEGS